MARIGIMQGRLLPPIGGRIQAFPEAEWRTEFPRAAQAGLDCIEWIYETAGADNNPLGSEAGLAELRTLSAAHGVQVLSVCADYFMDKPLLRAPERELSDRLEILCWLMRQASRIGVERIVVPFVDPSRIDTPSEMDGVIELLSTALGVAGETSVELHLETSLPPARFADMLRRLDDPFLKANYDTGNSASLGYRPAEEFEAYGDRIGSVHIKDRVLNGGTVPIETGNTDFAAVFAGLKRIGYGGDFILQVARGNAGDEVAWATQNKAFVERNWTATVS